MTPEELAEATVEEAKRRINKNYEIGIGWLPGDVARLAARLAREGWTPPEPEVDPDLMAFREWLMERRPVCKTTAAEGYWDRSVEAEAYLAGTRMAREQERKRTDHAVAFTVRVMVGRFKDLDEAKREACKTMDTFEDGGRD